MQMQNESLEWILPCPIIAPNFEEKVRTTHWHVYIFESFNKYPFMLRVSWLTIQDLHDFKINCLLCEMGEMNLFQKSSLHANLY